MELLLQSIVTGILLGGLYALIGVGLSLIFGIMGLTNIAHGDFMIMSSFLIMVISTNVFNNLIAALAVTAVIMVGIGILVQKFLINRILEKSAVSALLATFGLSIIIRNVLELFFGVDYRILNTAYKGIIVVDLPGLSISLEYLLNFIIAVVVVFTLHMIVKKTNLGRSIRAASANKITAELMGIDTKKVYMYAMAIAMITVSVSGMMVGSTFMFMPSSGTDYLIIAFGVVAIGGMGSIMGTLLGGMVLGLAQLLGAFFFTTGYQTLIGYLVLLVILTLRPRGLLGNMVRK